MAQLTRDLARLATNVHPGKWSAEELSRFVWSLHRGRYAAEAPLLAYVSTVVVQMPSAELDARACASLLAYLAQTAGSVDSNEWASKVLRGPRPSATAPPLRARASRALPRVRNGTAALVRGALSAGRAGRWWPIWQTRRRRSRRGRLRGRTRRACWARSLSSARATRCCLTTLRAARPRSCPRSSRRRRRPRSSHPLRSRSTRTPRRSTRSLPSSSSRPGPW